jgi:hypothetical protein
VWLRLEDLGQQSDLDPLFALLKLQAWPEAEPLARSLQILARRPDLLSAVQMILLERLPQVTREDFMKILTIPAKTLRQIRAAQERPMARARCLFACSTDSVARSVMAPRTAFRPCN